ncbi:MAG TPA: DNA topoisomerase IB [Nevskiaceae bacterium]|nr:DNA topoisomerase IB [Nevskiaceae bacterium]
MDRSDAGAERSAEVLAAAAIGDAREAGLRYVRADQPGLSRLRAGRAFRYIDAQGRAVNDAATLARIRRLAIPPAYQRVWICADARGHLQATGYDARGRKQYRYHADWRAARDGSKFARMVEFGERLPRLRRRVARDLKLPALPRDKVLATVVAVLDATRVRIGNDEYARANRSYGLTTLRNRHVDFIRDGRARFTFRGKGGAVHDVVLDDRRLSAIVRRCQQLPGQRLFQYVDDDGAVRAIDSGDVNDYLRDAMGADFTAKDFRTWGATLSAIARMARTPLPSCERDFKSCIADAVREVAAELRNTPAVCRKSYINPLVFSAWRDGTLHRLLGNAAPAATRRAEAAALAFLRAAARPLPMSRRLRKRATAC